jgi:hypothetical protein
VVQVGLKRKAVCKLHQKPCLSCNWFTSAAAPPPFPQGTKSSKRKKQAKLKRVMHSLKRHARKEAAAGNEGFAALHLLHDPQVTVRGERGAG